VAVTRTSTIDSARTLLALPGEKWDIVYVEGKEKDRAEKMCKSRRGLMVVDDEWIVQSLILGRLIDD
jgi:hypothetical protein